MSTPAEDPLAWICRATGAATAEPVASVQSLWSGYGEILRVRLQGSAESTVILKRVEPPVPGGQAGARHPRGWNTRLSHERKLASYRIEQTFYRDFASRCTAEARVPHYLAASHADGQWLLLLEDLDAAGFDGRRTTPSERELNACLAWLAEFHASFLAVAPTGLWDVGTYWHLATRPDELKALRDERLRVAAPLLDARLNQCRFQTLVHGDAKIANFCFDRTGEAVAAVDFQYVGGGCGIKDVAYFLSSCMTEQECESEAPRHLDTYFGLLHESLKRHAPATDRAALEAEWRAMYPIAWADFYRFLAGWSPDHWKIHGYSDRLTQQVLDDVL